MEHEKFSNKVFVSQVNALIATSSNLNLIFLKSLDVLIVEQFINFGDHDEALLTYLIADCVRTNRDFHSNVKDIDSIDTIQALTSSHIIFSALLLLHLLYHGLTTDFLSLNIHLFNNVQVIQLASRVLQIYFFSENLVPTYTKLVNLMRFSTHLHTNEVLLAVLKVIIFKSLNTRIILYCSHDKQGTDNETEIDCVNTVSVTEYYLENVVQHISNVFGSFLFDNRSFLLDLINYHDYYTVDEIFVFFIIYLLYKNYESSFNENFDENFLNNTVKSLLKLDKLKKLTYTSITKKLIVATILILTVNKIELQSSIELLPTAFCNCNNEVLQFCVSLCFSAYSLKLANLFKENDKLSRNLFTSVLNSLFSLQNASQTYTKFDLYPFMFFSSILYTRTYYSNYISMNKHSQDTSSTTDSLIHNKSDNYIVAKLQDTVSIIVHINCSEVATKILEDQTQILTVSHSIFDIIRKLDGTLIPGDVSINAHLALERSASEPGAILELSNEEKKYVSFNNLFRYFPKRVEFIMNEFLSIVEQTRQSGMKQKSKNIFLFEQKQRFLGLINELMSNQSSIYKYMLLEFQNTPALAVQTTATSMSTSLLGFALLEFFKDTKHVLNSCEANLLQNIDQEYDSKINEHKILFSNLVLIETFKLVIKLFEKDAFLKTLIGNSRTYGKFMLICKTNVVATCCVLSNSNEMNFDNNNCTLMKDLTSAAKIVSSCSLINIIGIQVNFLHHLCINSLTNKHITYQEFLLLFDKVLIYLEGSEVTYDQLNQYEHWKLFFDNISNYKKQYELIQPLDTNELAVACLSHSKDFIQKLDRRIQQLQNTDFSLIS